ncbi:MAG TPA: magnesium chelatase, partial [Methanothrix sp.]|nr:magnesium chelatase [Methanothrix sp.]
MAGQDQERSAIGPSNPASGTFSLSLARSKRLLYPFAAIVGQERMLRALILNAINPSIGGVLIRGQKGTAKSTAVRGLAEVLPGIEVVVGCRFGCDPRDEENLCWECADRLDEGVLPTEVRPMRVVDLPVGATEDRVVGSLDMERALRGGERAFEPGILAEANRGILYVDEINLLDDY